MEEGMKVSFVPVCRRSPRLFLHDALCRCPSTSVFCHRDMYNYFAYHREAFLERYHQRSNVETAFFMIKSKFSDYLRSKTETACINEIYPKLICHNICCLIPETFELGIQANF